LWICRFICQCFYPQSAIRRKKHKDTTVKIAIPLTPTVPLYGVTIGEYAFIGAGCVVNSDVALFALMAGVAGRQIGWMSRWGERIPLPLEGEGSYTCINTGNVYALKNNGIVMQEGY
jgi:UDP-2-acetamido-3-amino-2,3-dideoxy-glucuronate N-acetyltransferase